MRSTLWQTLIFLGMALSLTLALGLTPAFADSDRLANRTQGPPPGSEQPADYRLGSGDHVKVTVFGQQDLTGDYAIDGTGRLAFPLIGAIDASGMTAHDLEKAIGTKLSPDFIRNPHVSVQIMSYRPFYIVGEVKTPGSYAFVSGMTVINAVALAGGFTYRAREDDFYVTHMGQDGKRVRTEASPDSRIEPGDVITVRERYF